jgi:hypothetical protein
MGVLNKLKSRMSGPAKAQESNTVYGFDTGRARGSGVAAVNMGLAAGQSQAPIQNNGPDIAETMAGIGANIATAMASMPEGDRSKSIAKSKKDGKTGKEAREIWKKEKEKKKAKLKAEKEQKKRDKKAEKIGIDTTIDITGGDDASQYDNDIYNV